MAEEYEKQIAKQEKERQKFLNASYESAKRGYVVDGKVYGKSELDAEIAKFDKAIADIKSGQQSTVTAEFKASDVSSTLGPEYEKLVKAATDIKVTDYDSSIDALKAWRNVQTYVENNKAIKTIGIKVENPSIMEIATSWLRTGVGPKYISVTKDVNPENVLANVKAAVSTALAIAEKDTTEKKQVQVTKAGKNLIRYKTVVTDEPTLSARQVEIDSVIAGQEAPTEIATSARKGILPKSSVTLVKPSVVKTPKTVAKATNAKTPATPKYGSKSQFEAANPYVPFPGGGGDGSGVGGGGGNDGNKKKDTGLKKDEVLFGGKKVKVGGSKWQQIIQDEFGSLWDVYNDNPDVHKVIDQSVKEGWYNDETKLTSRLQNTNWFRTTESATRQYNIKRSTDPATLDADINREVENTRALSLKINSGVVLADGTLRSLAENKIKYGWTDQQLSNAIGSESVATATSGGPQGMSSLRQGTIATGLKVVADDYSQKVDQGTFDMWTSEILKGTKTKDQFTDQMKMQASQQYRSLAPQIDKGQTVKTAVTMYANATQNILGIDPSTIDWTQDKWNSALNYKDPKTNEYRTMDAFEWNKHLRAQPEWKNTDDARSIYRNLALNLVSGFGKAI